MERPENTKLLISLQLIVGVYGGGGGLECRYKPFTPNPYNRYVPKAQGHIGLTRVVVIGVGHLDSLLK